MSQFPDQSGTFIFDLDNVKPGGDDSVKQLAWAQRVFAEPVLTATKLNLIIPTGNKIDNDSETALYVNLQSRDSELGVQLIDARKLALREAVQSFRQAITKRERDLSVGRTRIEALEKINASEPNPQLRYGTHVFDEILVQIDTDNRELNYLRRWVTSFDALEAILQTFDDNNRVRVSEQLTRMVSQSFRADMRQRAFAQNFPNAVKARLPKLEPYAQNNSFNGLLLPLTAGTIPIAIDLRTAAYLRHFLEAISQLAAQATEQLRTGKPTAENEWFPLLSLLRAIVEFFFICNFEMPFIYTHVAVDAEDTAQIWSFDQASASWQPTTDDVNTNRYLKRISSEVARLFADNSELVNARTRDELNRFLKLAVPATNKPQEMPPLYPYTSCGLAEFDLNAANQKIKLQNAFTSIGTIIENIIADQPSCQRIASSPLGGPLQTLLGMAEFDARAFGLTEAQTLKDKDRFQMLANFWSRMGRWRAIAMLGEDYAKKVTKGMESLGQPGPEHPTFLSIVLKPTITSIAMAKGVEMTDPFSSLVIADQIRLIEMINGTWVVANDFLNRFKDVHSQGKLKRILENVPQFTQESCAELQKRFNTKWIGATNWIWSLLRNTTPNLWEFWSRLGNDNLWEIYIKQQPLAGLSGIIKLWCETARLILLIETSGSGITEKLSTNAEMVSQTILDSVQSYLQGNTMPAVLSDTINYYYDPEVRLDSWRAFTTSFHTHLRQMESDLRAMNAGEKHLAGVRALVEQLATLFPGSESSDASQVSDIIVTPPVSPDQAGALTEKDAEIFSKLFFEMLGMPDTDTIIFLKVLSLLARKETKDIIYQTSHIRPLIERLLPVRDPRLLLFTLPNTTKNYLNYLVSLDNKVLDNEEMMVTLKERTKEYFEQVQSFSQNLSMVSAHIPNILPLDRELIVKFLNAQSPANRDLPFLMVFACDQLVMDICPNNADRFYQVESAIGKIRAYLRETLEAKFEEPSVEIFPIGGGRIACREDNLFLTGHNESFELSFSEPDKAMSNYLLSKISSIKFSFAAQLLRAEFPNLRFIAQV